MLEVATQFAWGLHFAHEMGVIHQDVKPLNALMWDDGTMKVCDFGLAGARMRPGGPISPAGGQQSIMVSVGGLTPSHCSPEQVAGRLLDRRTDIWSWAVSVLQMFQGEVTWQSGSLAAQALEAYLEQGEEDQTIPAMPQGLADLLRSCLQQNPDDRPRTAQECARAIVGIYETESGVPFPRSEPKVVGSTADSLNNRAASLLDLGKIELAERTWREALGKDPAHLSSSFNLALLEWREGKITDIEAVRWLEELRKGHPTGRVNYLLGLLQAERLAYDEALKELKQGTAGGEVGQLEISIISLFEGQATDLPKWRGILEQKGEWANSVCLSDDGQFLLTGLVKETQFWSIQTGECQMTFYGHSGEVTSVALSRDNKIAVTGGDDHRVCVWETSTGRLLKTYEGHSGRINSLSMDVDARLVLSGADDEVFLWDRTSGQRLRSFPGHNELFCVCLSEDGRFAVSSSDVIRLWDVATESCLRTFKCPGYAYTISLSFDGNFILSGGENHTLRLWGIGSDECLREFKGHTWSIRSCTFSPDSAFVVSWGNDHTIRLWQTNNGRCIRTFDSFGLESGLVQWKSPGLLSCTEWKDASIVVKSISTKLFRQAPLAHLELSGVQAVSTALSLQNSHEHYLSLAGQAIKESRMAEAKDLLLKARSVPGQERSSRSVELWNELTRRGRRMGLRDAWRVHAFEGQMISDFRLSLDGRNVLGVGDGQLWLWDVASGKKLRRFEDEKARGATLSHCLSSEGDIALTYGGIGGAVALWDVSSGRLKRLLNNKTRFSAFGISLTSDGRFALLVDGDKTLCVWDLSADKRIQSIGIPTSPLIKNQVSRDDRHVFTYGGPPIGDPDCLLRCWEIATGKFVRAFEGHIKTVSSLCLSLDGTKAVTGSGDNTLRLWNAESGHCLHVFEGHTGGVGSVCFSSDSRFVISGSSDNTVRIWDVDSGKCIRVFDGYTSVDMSLDSRFIVVKSVDKAMQLWELDWETEVVDSRNWDDGASPHLEIFLTLHSPYAGTTPPEDSATPHEIEALLKRRGLPQWSEDDFTKLLFRLGCAGFGWLRPEGVRQELARRSEMRGASDALGSAQMKSMFNRFRKILGVPPK